MATNDVPNINVTRLSAGTVVDGRFEVVSMLGQGGMAVVYKAIDLVMQRPVALKMLDRNRCTEQESLTRFKQEAKTVSALRHPNIMGVLSFGIWESRPFIVSEYLEGVTLSGLLKETTRLP